MSVNNAALNRSQCLKGIDIIYFISSPFILRRLRNQSRGQLAALMASVQ